MNHFLFLLQQIATVAGCSRFATSPYQPLNSFVPAKKFFGELVPVQLECDRSAWSLVAAVVAAVVDVAVVVVDAVHQRTA